MKIAVIIPARGGSKRLKDKNIYPLLGKPLMAYTIDACKQSKYVTDIIVSSDSQSILDVATEFGAVGLMRDPQYADDHTPKIVAIRHVLENQWFKENGTPDIIVVAQANSPEYSVEDMDKAIKLMLDNNLWEVMSADPNGIQNAAFRVIRMPHVYNEFLSAHCAFVVSECLDVHTIEDIEELEKRLG